MKIDDSEVFCRIIICAKCFVKIYKQLILLNNLYQIRASSVSRDVPLHGPQYMVLERLIHSAS